MPCDDWIKYSKQLKEYLHPSPRPRENAHKPHVDRKTEHTLRAHIFVG